MVAVLRAAGWVQASQPFTPDFEVALSSQSPGASSTVHTAVSVPAGQHAMATWSALLPVGWTVSAAPTGQTVGRGMISVDLDCNASIETFGPFPLVSQAADPESVALWRAQVAPWWSISFVVEDAEGQLDIGASLLDITQAHSFCGPETIAISLFGLSEPGHSPVMTNPTASGSHEWTGSYVSMGAQHNANSVDIVCVGTPCPQPGAADIVVEPHWPANYVDPARPGPIPVAVLSDTALGAAAAVNPLAFELEGARPVRWGLQDVDSDGDQDMVFHFLPSAMAISPGQDQLCGTGVTFGGYVFADCDSVQVIAPGSDSDGDSMGAGIAPLFTDDLEASMGTDPLSACGGPSAWPPDVTGDSRVNISDVLTFKPHLPSQLGGVAYSPRVDFVFDGTINIADVLALRPFMNFVCGSTPTPTPSPSPTPAPSPSLAPTPTETPSIDADGDSFSNALEEFIGTDPLRACAETATAKDETVDAFPPDFDDSQAVNIGDVLAIKPYFGDPEVYDRRYDLNASGAINIADVLATKPHFNSNCG